MRPSFRSAAFGSWVPHFVAWSNARSGIDRFASEGEVAAHRGLFALQRVEVRHVEMFRHHVVGPNRSIREGSAGIAAIERWLSFDAADPDVWLERFLAGRPFERGNGRCGRALWMWQLIRDGRAFPAVDAGDARGPAQSAGKRTCGLALN